MTSDTVNKKDEIDSKDIKHDEEMKEDIDISPEEDNDDTMTVGECCEAGGCEPIDNTACCDEEDGGKNCPGSSLVANDSIIRSPAKNYSLAASILLGDFFHNFTDGIFVGTAFLLCSRDLAITIAAATIYHELAQEISDHLLLTRHCHFSPFLALTLNFLGGLSVMFGAILVLAYTEDLSTTTIGCILASGSGVYIYLAGVECLPRVNDALVANKMIDGELVSFNKKEVVQNKLIAILTIVCGAVPIGLVLLNHGHCDA